MNGCLFLPFFPYVDPSSWSLNEICVTGFCQNTREKQFQSISLNLVFSGLFKAAGFKEWNHSGIFSPIFCYIVCACLRVTLMWVFSRHSGILPQSKSMHVRLTGDSKLPVVYVVVCLHMTRRWTCELSRL